MAPSNLTTALSGRHDVRASTQLLERLSVRGIEDVRQFFIRQAVNTLLGNSDAHLKNFAFLYRNGIAPELSPAYDIVSVAALPGFAASARTLPSTASSARKPCRPTASSRARRGSPSASLPPPSRMPWPWRTSAGRLYWRSCPHLRACVRSCWSGWRRCRWHGVDRRTGAGEPGVRPATGMPAARPPAPPAARPDHHLDLRWLRIEINALAYRM
jgi:hypothetical protein